MMQLLWFCSPLITSCDLLFSDAKASDMSEMYHGKSLIMVHPAKGKPCRAPELAPFAQVSKGCHVIPGVCSLHQLLMCTFFCTTVSLHQMHLLLLSSILGEL